MENNRKGYGADFKFKVALEWDKCLYLANYVEHEMVYANLYRAVTFFIEVWYSTAESKIDSLLNF